MTFGGSEQRVEPLPHGIGTDELATRRRSYCFARLPVLEKSRKTMDARAPPQLDFDANDVRALIAKYLRVDRELVTDEVHFRNDFDFDSLDRLELLILIEEEFFGVEFSDTADQIEVVGDVIRHIEITTKAASVKNR